jgi:hypothetical protein
MRKRNWTAGAAAVAAVLLAATYAPAAELSDYTIKQLLEPCTEGDNDSRWGQVAEQECEQYIRGFTDAYLTTVAGGAAGVACLPPPGNRDTEIRWAFMKWVHRNFDTRGRPAAEGLMATLRDVFGCK